MDRKAFFIRLIQISQNLCFQLCVYLQTSFFNCNLVSNVCMSQRICMFKHACET